MKEIFKLKAFWVVVILATAVFLAALLNFNREYKSEADVLVIPKNSVTVENSGQVLENLKFISFGENSKIKAYRFKNSGILKIISFNADKSQAENLNRQAVENFIATASRFYNIKTDLDIRIISGPITKQSTVAPAFILFIESLLGAFALASLAFFISFSIFRKEKSENKSFPRIIFKRQEKIIGPLKKQLERKKESLVSFNKKAAAPDNLPIAQDSNIIPQEKTESITREATLDEVKMRLDQLQEKPIIKEATPEEVKERLNKLLSGKF